MKIIFSNITNNTFARSAALGLANEKLLAEYYSTLAVFPGSLWDKVSSIPGLSEIQRRQFDPILKPYMNTLPWREISRQISQKAGFSSLVRHETGVFNVDSVSRELDKRVAKNLEKSKLKGVKGVYSYEDMSMHSFREAKRLGLRCLYDLPIGYWRESNRLLEIERQAWPEWEMTLTGFNDSERKLAQKDEELQLADHIFVASNFTAKSLNNFPHKLGPVHIIPYGFPPVNKNKRSYIQENSKKPLKLLFVGSLTQRKGVANLFSAVEGFGDRVELTLVGYKASNNCKALDNALAKHKWIPTLSHDKVLELMQESDVLVFPSLFEGFGLVMTEAMSQGTPVITTDRTAGPDIITDNEDGWLIEAGSTEALRMKIEDLLMNPEKVAKAGHAAKEAATKWTWQDYGRKLSETIIKII